MDVNARINWIPGLKLSAQVFKELDENLHLRRVLSFRVASGNQYGLLPRMPFCADGMFSSGNFEMPALECTALLPSGEILCVNEPVSIPMPNLGEGVYLLCVGFGEGTVTYERDSVPYIRPEYSACVLPIADVPGKDIMPLAKFVVSGGTCSVDKNYLPPCFSLESFPVFKEYHSRLESLLSALIGHANMPEGDGKATFLRCLSRLKSLKDNAEVEALVSLAGKISGAAEYFIFGSREDSPQRPEISRVDAGAGLDAVCAYLEAASAVLDKTPIVDNSIDYDKLKSEIKEELYSRMIPELSDSLALKLRETLNEDIDSKLRSALKDYIDGTFRRQIEDSLKVTLSEELGKSLYDSLYKALYDALFVPEPEEEDTFVPNI